jgi:Zn-dependent protease
MDDAVRAREDAMGRALRIGRLFGIPLRLDLSWFLGLAFVVTGARGLWGHHASGAGPLLLSLAFALAFFASVLAHELSHALAARVLGVPTAEITLFVFGGVARITSEPPTPGGEALMAMAGPLLSVTLGGLFALAAELASGAVADLLSLLALANGVLGVFNLLPGFPLDGGRVARAAVWRLSGRRVLATRVTAWIGRGLAAGLVGWGLWSIVTQGTPRYLLHVILGLFLYRAAVEGERAARHADALAGRTVGEFLGPRPVTVGGTATLADLAAAGLVPERPGAPVVVVNGHGQPIGTLSAERLARVPPGAWPSTLAGALALPLDPALLVPATESLAAFLRRYRPDGAPGYLVVDGDGRLAGAIDRRAVLRLLRPSGPDGLAADSAAAGWRGGARSGRRP